MRIPNMRFLSPRPVGVAWLAALAALATVVFAATLAYTGPASANVEKLEQKWLDRDCDDDYGALVDVDDWRGIDKPCRGVARKYLAAVEATATTTTTEAPPITTTAEAPVTPPVATTTEAPTATKTTEAPDDTTTPRDPGFGPVFLARTNWNLRSCSNPWGTIEAAAADPETVFSSGPDGARKDACRGFAEEYAAATATTTTSSTTTEPPTTTEVPTTTLEELEQQWADNGCEANWGELAEEAHQWNTLGGECQRIARDYHQATATTTTSSTTTEPPTTTEAPSELEQVIEGWDEGGCTASFGPISEAAGDIDAISVPACKTFAQAYARLTGTADTTTTTTTEPPATTTEAPPSTTTLAPTTTTQPPESVGCVSIRNPVPLVLTVEEGTVGVIADLDWTTWSPDSIVLWLSGVDAKDFVISREAVLSTGPPYRQEAELSNTRAFDYADPDDRVFSFELVRTFLQGNQCINQCRTVMAVAPGSQVDQQQVTQPKCPPVTGPRVIWPPTTPVTQPPDTPVTQPPVTQPPVTQPPVTQPPVTQPPVTQPPVTQPPVTQPPVTQPPVTQPPVTQPPVGTTTTSTTTQPPDPPVTQPPVTQPPDTPVTQPPTTDPPDQDPPDTPVTQPPVTQPPVTQPPVTQPPVTQPPVTQPPVTQPPVGTTTTSTTTQPPDPPVTQPPVTQPPTTDPPDQDPPDPPTTQPPPPTTQPPQSVGCDNTRNPVPLVLTVEEGTVGVIADLYWTTWSPDSIVLWLSGVDAKDFAFSDEAVLSTGPPYRQEAELSNTRAFDYADPDDKMFSFESVRTLYQDPYPCVNQWRTVIVTVTEQQTV